MCVSTTLFGGPDNDPRPPRQGAMVRFEMYASWLVHYSHRSRIFLLDFRDIYFQRDPFASLPRADEGDGAPWLRLFAEHMPISNSSYNSRWIKSCYGAGALTAPLGREDRPRAVRLLPQDDQRQASG